MVLTRSSSKSRASQNKSRLVRVCVTGATGFLGSHITKDLLKSGRYHVVGTVRDASNESRIAPLLALEGARERLTIMSANLVEEKSFDEAVRGCEGVFHVASPVMIKSNDPENDILKPAVDGTLSVLRSCERSGTVRRVVCTGSMTAVVEKPTTGLIVTERECNEEASLETNAYGYSKARAERAAREFVASLREDESRHSFELTVVIPSAIFGPNSIFNTVPTSLVLGERIMKGEVPGMPNLNFALTDVRDCAKVHRLAFETSDLRDRYLCSRERGIFIADIARVLREHFPHRPVPSDWMRLPDWVVLAYSIFDPDVTFRWMKDNLSAEWWIDNSSCVEGLDFVFRPWEETIRDLGAWLESTEGLLPPRSPPRRWFLLWLA